MTILKYYNPEFKFNTLGKVFDEISNNENRNPNKKEFRPQVDIVETASDFVIAITVPGIRKEDISIELTEDKLIVSGERKALESDVSVKIPQATKYLR